jgi:threonine dehydrogenase-like Zn-dependent dehydrogenase
MLAARAYKGEVNLRLEEVESPAATPGDVVIKVESAGLTNGLLGLWRRGMFPVLPRTLGHQGAGTIADIGPGVTDCAVGDRVRIHPMLSCRNCEFCLNDGEQFCAQACCIGHGIWGADALPLYTRYLDGALAEFVRVPAWAVDVIPATMSFDLAAKVHDVADGVRALRQAQLDPGATLVVTAATGVLGSVIVRLATLFGVGRLIAVGRSSERLAQTKSLNPGLVEVIALDRLGEDWGQTNALTAAIRELVPRGPDAVIDFFDAGPGTWQAIMSLRTAGTGVVMAPNPERPPIPTVAIVLHAWRVVGTRGSTRADAHQVMRWMAEGLLRFDDLISHRFALADIASAEKTVGERLEPTQMVVVRPDQGSTQVQAA